MNLFSHGQASHSHHPNSLHGQPSPRPRSRSPLGQVRSPAAFRSSHGQASLEGLFAFLILLSFLALLSVPSTHLIRQSQLSLQSSSEAERLSSESLNAGILSIDGFSIQSPTHPSNFGGSGYWMQSLAMPQVNVSTAASIIGPNASGVSHDVPT